MNIKKIILCTILCVLLPVLVSAETKIIQPQINKKNIAGIEAWNVHDLFSGAGVYQIPLLFPQGPRALKTELSLNYNSYSSDAFNPYGYAWDINIPSISRNSKKGMSGIYDHNDFIHSGQELIALGNHWYAEKEIRGAGKYIFTDNIWKQYDGKGNTFYYGVDETGRLSNKKGDKVYKWYLQKQVDSRGNFIEYDYFKDHNQVYLKTITYANGLYKIEFFYDDKKRSLTSYRTQFEVKTSKILREILFYTHDVPIKSYGFFYDDKDAVYSHLISVEERDRRVSEDGGRNIYRKYDFEYGKGKDIHLLKKIKNNKGVELQFDYKPSVFYKDDKGVNLNPRLPFNMKTLHRIIYDDIPSGNRQIHDFEYEGGAFYYDVDDIYGRGYAGFHKVTKKVNLVSDGLENIENPGKKEVYYFHQGKNSRNAPELGEYEDHISKKGRMFRKEIYNGDTLWKVETTQWRTDFKGERWYITKDFVRNDSYQDDKKISQLKKYRYDDFGNIIELGEYFQGVGEELLLLQRKTIREYAKNLSKHMHGFLSKESWYDTNDTLLSQKQWFYDDLPYGALTWGDVTLTRKYVSGDEYVDEKKVYDTYGNMLRFINPRGFETNYVYDRYHLYPTRVTNAKGFGEDIEYDYTVGKPARITNANAGVRTFEYDILGRLVSEGVGSGSDIFLVKKRLFDDISVPNTISQWTYFDKKSQDFQLKKDYLNGLGQVLESYKTFEGNFIQSQYLYDAQGNRTFVGYPVFTGESEFIGKVGDDRFGVLYDYDIFSRVKKITNSDGEVFYDYHLLSFDVTNQKGVESSFEYDIYGNLIGVLEPGDSQTSYFYTPLGLLSKIVDAQGNERSFGHDFLGRVVYMEDLHAPDDMDFGVRKYEYDKNGNLLAFSALSGAKILYKYDEIDRRLEEFIPSFSGSSEERLKFVYDEGEFSRGLLSAYSKNIVGGTGGIYSESYDYDVFGNMVSERKVYSGDVYAYEYGYDLLGQKLSQVFPDGKGLEYIYKNGILQGCYYDGIALLKEVSYNPVGKISFLKYGNGAITRNIYDYEHGYRLSKKGLLFGDLDYGVTSYGFDNVGNIIHLREAGNIGGFEKDVYYKYDDLNRLVQAKYRGSNLDPLADSPHPDPLPRGEGEDVVINYAYDSIGNIVSNSFLGDYEYRDNGYNNPHSVTSITPPLSFDGSEALSGSLSYIYDKNGNVVGDSKGMYVYNVKDELLESSTNSGVLTNYVYNDHGIRVEKRSSGMLNRYLNADYEREIGYTGSGEVLRTSKYIFFGTQKLATIESLDGEENIIYHHEDHLGGGNIDMSRSGGLLQVVDYFPFGKIRNRQNDTDYSNKYLFGGKEQDSETDLQYFEARYYDNAVGRFRSIDRVFWEVGGIDQDDENERGDKILYQPQRLNAYSYSLNNPILYIDKDGESATVALGPLMGGLVVSDGPLPFGDALAGVIAIGAISYDTYQKFFGGDESNVVNNETAGVSDSSGSASPGGNGKKPRKEEKIDTKHGEISLTHHAVNQMSKRNITMEQLKNTINQGESFKYLKEGKVLTGFYNKTTQIFAGKGTNGITTVINKASSNYIKNLKNTIK